MCDSEIMRQRKGATIKINEEPKEEVARREQSKGGMMGGWMVWISCARYPQQRREGKKELVLTLLRRGEGWGCTLLYSRGQGGISGTAGTSGMRDAPPGLWAFRCCRCRSRCSCSACIVARICNCCAMKSVVFGLEGPGGISVGTERKTRKV